LLPNDWLSIYKSQVRSLSYQKRNRIGGKKRKREQICSSSSHPNPLFQISRVGMEDSFPKSKRRQRIEHIWAQNYSMNPQATMMEVKKPCSPLRSTGFLFVSDVQIHSCKTSVIILWAVCGAEYSLLHTLCPVQWHHSASLVCLWQQVDLKGNTLHFPYVCPFTQSNLDISLIMSPLLNRNTWERWW